MHPGFIVNLDFVQFEQGNWRKKERLRIRPYPCPAAISE
jgi:hypothetical protein